MSNEFVDRSVRDLATIHQRLKANGAPKIETISGQLDLLDGAYAYQFRSDQSQVVTAMASSPHVIEIINELRKIPELSDRTEFLRPILSGEITRTKDLPYEIIDRNQILVAGLLLAISSDPAASKALLYNEDLAGLQSLIAYC